MRTWLLFFISGFRPDLKKRESGQDLQCRKYQEFPGQYVSLNPFMKGPVEGVFCGTTGSLTPRLTKA